MGDLRDRIQGDESPVERMLDWIPGFKGYREQTQRREADRVPLVGREVQSPRREVGEFCARLRPVESAGLTANDYFARVRSR